MTTTHVLPLRLVTGATPDRVLRAASSRRASGPAASVSRVASVTGPTPGSERRMAASPGPLSWPAVLGSGIGLAQGRAELLELACGLMELLVGQAEPGDKGAKMENSSLRDTRGHRDRWLTEDGQHRWCIELANAVLPEQPRQRRLAQARRLGRGRRHAPQRQDPLGCHVIAQREKLRVVTPELLANPVAQAHALLLELLGQ